MYSSLRVVTPPACEPVLLDEMKQHLRVDQDGDDVLIGALITTARALIEMQIGRAMITQTLLWTMSQDPPTGALPLLPMPLLVLPVILTAPQVMNKPLELPRCPVQAVLSVQETDTDGTVNALTPSDYIVDLSLDPARLRLFWLTMPRFLQHIQVVFTCGYGNSGADVPFPLLVALKMWVAYLYEHRGDNDEAAGKPPRAIEYLLAPYTVMFFA